MALRLHRSAKCAFLACLWHSDMRLCFSSHNLCCCGGGENSPSLCCLLSVFVSLLYEKFSLYQESDLDLMNVKNRFCTEAPVASVKCPFALSVVQATSPSLFFCSFFVCLLRQAYCRPWACLWPSVTWLQFAVLHVCVALVLCTLFGNAHSECLLFVCVWMPACSF